MPDLKKYFLLDPHVIFLNHGSFGATPAPVFEEYQRWQRALENQPVKFLGRELYDRLRSAREALGKYLHAPADDLVFLPNATFAVNLVSRSLDLQAGDEVLISNHEYGACEKAWQFQAEKTGLVVKKAIIPLPLPSAEEILEIIWREVSKNTRIIFLSQISSPTAIQLPIREICQKAQGEGLLVFIDGAHAPGQIDLDLAGLGADFYTGNCHKWLMAPKGSAFLYTKPNRQSLLKPLVISWGWGEDSPIQTNSRYLRELEFWGTKDPAAYLSVPSALKFMEDHAWDQVRIQCRKMLSGALKEIGSLTGMPSIYGENGDNFIQLGAAELPPGLPAGKFQNWLYDEYAIEIPIIPWEGRWLIRLSVQGYNSQGELDQLIAALARYLEISTS